MLSEYEKAHIEIMRDRGHTYLEMVQRILAIRNMSQIMILNGEIRIYIKERDI